MSASAGASPIVPKCGRIGTRIPFKTSKLRFVLSMVDQETGIVDRRVFDTVRISDAGPAEAVDSFRPVTVASGIDLVDCHHFARLIASQQVLVVVPPPR